MSTLILTTFKDRVSTKSVGAETIIECVPKIWGLLSGSTAVAGASFGISSTTDTGTGQATVSFTTSFGSANYAPAYTVRKDTLITTAGNSRELDVVSLAAGSVVLNHGYRDTGAAAFLDPTNHFISIVGTLA